MRTPWAYVAITPHITKIYTKHSSKNEGTIVPTPVRIDVTPTWAATANLIILGIECGTLKGKAIAKEELHRMASLMDQLIDNQKEEELL